MAVGGPRRPARPAGGVAAGAGRARAGGDVPRRFPPPSDAPRLARAAAPPAARPRRPRPRGRGPGPRPPAARHPARGRHDAGRRHRRGARRLGLDGGRGLPAAQPPRGGEGGGGGVREAAHDRPRRPRGLRRAQPHQVAAHHRHRRAAAPARRRAPRDAAGRHGHRLRPRHRAHAAAPLAGEEQGDRPRHRRRQQRRRDRPRHRGRHGQGHGGARLHDPRGPRRARADAGARPGPVHRRDRAPRR